jgi:integrase
MFTLVNRNQLAYNEGVLPGVLPNIEAKVGAMENNPRKLKLSVQTIKKLTAEDRPYDVRDEECPGLILRVQPPSSRHPEGLMTYYTLYRFQGKQTRLRLGEHKQGDRGDTSPTAARRKAIQARADVSRGIDPAAKKKEVKAHTLKSFLKDVYRPWVTQNQKTGAATAARISASFKEFDNRKMAQITPWLIDKWRARRKADGRTSETANRDLAVLKSMLNKAVQWGHLSQNPIAGVKMDRSDRKRAVRCLNPAEEKDLRAALNKRESELREARGRGNEWRRDRGYEEYPNLDAVPFVDYLQPMVLISLNTGVRRGELFSLNWRDVDLQGRKITIRGEIAKSGNTRHIPLNDEALEVLQMWRSQTEGDGFVFESPKGGRFDNVKKAWHGVLEDAGLCLKEKDPKTGKERIIRYTFRWHDMRHTFASKLVMAGANLYDVKELLGHSTIAMTEIYAHLAPDHLAGTVRLLNTPRNVVEFPKQTDESER